MERDLQENLIDASVAIAVILSATVIFALAVYHEHSVAYSGKGSTYTLDTINIHGVDHEFIIKEHGQYSNGFTHSPECPCLKKGE